LSLADVLRWRLNTLVSAYWTPAHHAVEHEDAETLARLLAHGSDPNEAFDNMTLLTHAIDMEGDGSLQSGQPLTVHTTAVLLAFGADPELADPGGHTPMDMANHYGHNLAVKLLRAHISRRAAGHR
jgi:ankyrin repeat protein